MLIVENLKQLVASERRITAQIIELIEEIDKKRIYLQLGFPNLYSFLTEHIGYTAASAQRRIEAARLLTAVPEVKEDLKSGSLNLSQVALVAQSLRQKQKEEPALNFKPQDKKVLLESVKGLSLENSQRVISQTLDLEVKAHEKQKIQSDESVRVELTFTKAQSELLKKVKNLMSHVNPNPTTADVFEYLAKNYLKRKDPIGGMKTAKKANAEGVNKVKRKIHATLTRTTRIANAKPSISKVTSVTKVTQRQNVFQSRKAISASIKRTVWQRDQGTCQHLNQTTGKICGSNHLLEFDHIKRFSRGGDDSAQNLRLLCKAHNLWRG